MDNSVKYDFLVTEVQDVITQCLNLLRENDKIEKDLTLRQLYNKYLSPEVLPLDDEKLWNDMVSKNILKFFQFDTQVGGQVIRDLKPHSPQEMASCNSLMRLMAQEKGGETPSQRYKRMKENIGLWYQEMKEWNLSDEEIKILEPYYLPTYGTPAQQEELMMILMDDKICHFTLAEGNMARKVVAKKDMKKIPELHEKVVNQAPNPNFGEYVYETAIKPQLGYSFSLIHSLEYSYIGIQTVVLATKFPEIYWNTACLRVDSGLDEDASSNYDKIAKAVGNMQNHGINIKSIDINKSGYMFEPDEENNAILFGLKGLNGVGGDIIQEIIKARPYNSFNDFQEKTNINRTVTLALIKSGAFDKFSPREKIMEEYLRQISEPKKRITLQNFKGLADANLLPQEFDFHKRLFVFNKALKANCKVDKVYIVKDNYYDFYEEFFDISLLEPLEAGLGISQKTWDKIYKNKMQEVSSYFKKNQKEILEKYNNYLFKEQWNKYAQGTISTWEMDSLGTYIHEHELANIKFDNYNIVNFSTQPEQPVSSFTFKRNGREIPIYETSRLVGTVVGKDLVKSTVNILTVDSGVVSVKFTKDYFARYNRRISEIDENGINKVVEAGWFNRGSLIMVNGFRRGNVFIAKKYKKTNSHQLYKITKVHNDGTIEITNSRYGEEEEE